MKKLVFEVIKKSLRGMEVNFDDEAILSLIEKPKNYSNGDYAFPCFALSKILKMPPQEIAIEVRKKIGTAPSEFSSVETEGAYVNFFLNRNELAFDLIKKIKKEKDRYGKNSVGKKEKTMIEFPSPNTNKPLHLGHLRNMAIGESLSRISEFCSEKIVRANLNNDRGVHICKSMLAYEKWGKDKKPSKKIKSDHLVGDFYVLYSGKQKEKPELENEAHLLLGKWESGDKETIKLWRKMNKWALDGFEETYKKFGIRHDKEYFESLIYKKGKDIISDGVKKGIFEKTEDGAVKFDLKSEGLGEKYLLRADGTSIYITQDIYLAYLKQKQFNLTKSYYVVGNEQEYHFDVLFRILKKLGIPTTTLKHISYGMVTLPEGKMKSREGTVVDADDLIAKVESLVGKEITKREKVSAGVLKKRSEVLALAAIKYLLLKNDIKKNMMFNPKESISFDGNTGPYLLYSYARANSILRKAKEIPAIEPPQNLDEKEIELVLKLNEFPLEVFNSYKNLNPAVVANYAYTLAQMFNEFYHVFPVLKSDNETFRINVVEAFRQILKNALWLLGIDVLERM